MGVLTVFVDNVAPITVSPVTREVGGGGRVTLQYAGAYASIRQVAFADATRSSYEVFLVALPSASPGTIQASVHVQPDVVSSRAYTALFDLSLFDPGVVFSCSPQCAAQSEVHRKPTQPAQS